VEATPGIVIEACSALCTNSTPPDLEGSTWRGIEIQKGFVMGEWDYKFTSDGVTIRDPMGTITHGTVSVNIVMIIKMTDGPHAGDTMSVIYPDLAEGPETTTKAFCLSDWNGAAPDSIASAMLGTNMARVHALSKCNAWSKTCDFSHVLDQAVAVPAIYHRYAGMAEVFAGVSKAYRTAGHQSISRRGAPALAKVNHPADPCNAFLSCTVCVAHSTTDLTCGWCTDSTIVYNDTGDSGLKCGGFTNGQKMDFTCAHGFTTEDCTGYKCNYTGTQPTCDECENGDFSTKDLCEAQCKASEFAKCNTTSKTCEVCQQGTPGCIYTKDECDASCSQPRVKCNYATKVCEPCNPTDDPNCTQTAGSCDGPCKKSDYGTCNPLTGVCAPCTPGSGPGCVDQCSATCSRTLNFQCNNVTGVCEPGKGNQTQQDCAKTCKSPIPPKQNYGCNWTTAQPICQEGLGGQSLSDCLVNCHAVQFAKCNVVTGICESCQEGTPGCIFTADQCKASCQKSDLIGVYRGIQINTGFKITEWDFSFYPDGKVAFRDTTDPTQIYHALYSNGGQATQGKPVSFLITEAPDAGALPLHDGDTVQGMSLTQTGYAGVTKFMYLGMGLPGNPATNFDDAMSKLEFVLISCLDGKSPADGCDFGTAQVPE